VKLVPITVTRVMVRTGKDDDVMRTVVERELKLNLVLSPERGIAVPTRLAYRTDDPLAVHILFHVDSDTPVHWTFGRELLMEGMVRPCGPGDVRIWPRKSADRGLICMALSSPDGDALLEAPYGPVTAWLERTKRAVPPGTEHKRLGLDDGLRALFSRPWQHPADDEA
jgi:hypothetical protein